MRPRRIGAFAAVLSCCLGLAACTSTAADAPTPTTTSGAVATAPSPASAGCSGVGDMPDLTAVPTGTFGASLDVTSAGAGYKVLVDPPEESQHPDLPRGSAEEILVIPIVVTGTQGTVAEMDASAFHVFDSAGRPCIVPEDQVGYPVLDVQGLAPGQESVGSIGVLATRDTRDFIVVHVADGAPVAVWR